MVRCDMLCHGVCYVFTYIYIQCVYMYIYIHTYVPSRPLVYLSIHLSIYPFILPSFYLSLLPSFHPSIYLSLCRQSEITISNALTKICIVYASQMYAYSIMYVMISMIIYINNTYTECTLIYIHLALSHWTLFHIKQLAQGSGRQARPTIFGTPNSTEHVW